MIQRLVCALLLISPSLAIADQPNIILIFADDVGQEVLGCYGGESYKTPHLDALAVEGMRFDHCYSMPSCHPSRICLMTGQYPAELGNPKWGTFPNELEHQTFAAMLQQAGYATAIAGKWQLGLMKHDLQQPARLGFDEWSLFGWHEGPRYHEPMIYENGKLREDTKGKYGPDLYVQFLIDFIRQNRQKPFLAYYSMALCHDVTDDLEKPVPYGPDGHWLTYEEMANDMDHQVGKLITALDDMQLRDNTLILFTTDNGTASGSYFKHENGRQIRKSVFSKFHGRLVRGGKGGLTDRGTRVPLIANWPGKISPGTRSDQLVDLSDFIPSLAELAGIRWPGNSTINGHSFVPSLYGKVSPRSWAYSEDGAGRQFVRTQDYKLYSDGRFYHMADDADEKSQLTDTQLSAKQQAVKETLQQALDSIVKP